MAGHGGGAWKVAYADFVTAMMAFFLVMWITAQNQKVRQAVAHHFNQPFKPLPDLNSLRSGEAKRKFKGHLVPIPAVKPSPSIDPKDPQAPKPRVMTVRQGEQPATATVVFFADESIELDQDSQDRLKRLLPWIAGKPQKLELRGHASRRPLSEDSSFKDNWQLSYARCQAVLKFLEDQGIPSERVRLSQAGGYEPYSIRLTPQSQATNGRVEVYVLSERVEDLVGTPEERAERKATLSATN